MIVVPAPPVNPGCYSTAVTAALGLPSPARFTASTR
jgi:hypothetical protein